MMQKKAYPQVGETLFTETMANGLRVQIVPRPSYHKTFAMLTANYGAIDTRYRDATGQLVDQPAGIAHFLEHKLFEKADHDAFDLFAETGASANAFTGPNQTSYLFSTADRVAENLSILLDFVQTPYFSDASVAKEQGIIGQEIDMYADDPGNQAFMGLLKNLFPHHPASVDIAGSRESIAQITPAMLYASHEVFYQPKNLILTVVGNIVPEAILDLVAKDQAKRDLPAPTFSHAVTADTDVIDMIHQTTAYAAISRPKLLVGYKGTHEISQDTVGFREALARRLLMELILGDSGQQFQKWYDEGLIDDSFDFDFATQRTFNYAILGGDTSEPEELATQLTTVMQHARTQPDVNPVRLDQIKKAALGKFYTGLNGVSGVANQLAAYGFEAITPFDFPRLLAGLTFDDVLAAADLFSAANMTRYTLLPEGE